MSQPTAYRARDVADVFERIAPIASGIQGDELGFVHGNPSKSIRSLACLWQANTRSIKLAASCGADMLICHETLYLPVQQSQWYDCPTADEIQPNALRRALLEQHEMVVYRSHSNWDALPVDGVPDQAIASLGIKGLEVVATKRFFKVHRLPTPMTVDTLACHARAGLGLVQGGVRIYGDVAKPIRQFAFLVGGFGENQWHMPQRAREAGAEAIIIGEMSEFIVVAALEMGLAVVETLHSVSETPAIRRQAQMLTDRLSGLPVHYIPSGIGGFERDARPTLLSPEIKAV